MNNNFTKEEIVSCKGKNYPVVGGRLRLAHEAGALSISTEIVEYKNREIAVVKAVVKSIENTSTAYGTSSKEADSKIIDSLLELAETRAIARALRFVGYGVEYTGHEEMGKDSIVNNAKEYEDIETEDNINQYLIFGTNLKICMSIEELKTAWIDINASRKYITEHQFNELEKTKDKMKEEIK